MYLVMQKNIIANEWLRSSLGVNPVQVSSKSNILPNVAVFTNLGMSPNNNSSNMSNKESGTNLSGDTNPAMAKMVHKSLTHACKKI